MASPLLLLARLKRSGPRADASSLSAHHVRPAQRPHHREPTPALRLLGFCALLAVGWSCLSH